MSARRHFHKLKGFDYDGALPDKCHKCGALLVISATPDEWGYPIVHIYECGGWFYIDGRHFCPASLRARAKKDKSPMTGRPQ